MADSDRRRTYFNRRNLIIAEETHLHFHGQFPSWGLYPPCHSQIAHPVLWRHETLPKIEPGRSLLPRGQGRSYGDSCLNNDNVLLTTSQLNRLIGFDETGLLTCEAGVTIEDILLEFVPRGWFPPVTPGTKFVTVGGAIANDVHGKNHHKAGSFGHFVEKFELVRSDGSRVICSRSENSDLFHATIGGLGLTGLITWASIRLKPISSPFIDQEVIRFGCLEEFFMISENSFDFEYTVAWIDCLAKGKNLGRGLFIRGNHSVHRDGDPKQLPGKMKFSVPCTMPSFTLQPHNVRIFNELYYRKSMKSKTSSRVDFDPFFYPLDAINNWNRIYGKSGFLQYQCVVPMESGISAMRSILELTSKARQGSFLAVLKVFGNYAPAGLLSFPRPGVTIALDFPNTGASLFRLLDRCDEVVHKAKGALYPAKDARMSPDSFAHSFANLEQFSQLIDPQFSSSFWRRVRCL